MAKINRRIRKNQLDRYEQLGRTLRKLAAVGKHYEAARERAFYKAMEKVADTYTDPREAVRCYRQIAFSVVSSDSVSQFLREKYGKTPVSAYLTASYAGLLRLKA